MGTIALEVLSQYKKEFFSVQTINLWNNLPRYLVISGKDNPMYQYTLGISCVGKQLCRGGPGGLVIQQTKHEPTMSTGGRKDQKPPGMLQAKDCQQDQRSDCSPLLDLDETYQKCWVQCCPPWCKKNTRKVEKKQRRAIK